MIRNYMKIALRNLARNKSWAAVNVVGLALAFLCSTLLFLNAWHELSFDRHYPDKERMFKLYHYSLGAGGVETGASMGFPVAPTVKTEVPGVELASRMMWNENAVESEGKKMRLQVSLVDNDFFKLFSIPVLLGNAHAPLSDPGFAVMTEYAARRLFGGIDVIGKPISVKVTGEWKSLVVSTVIADFPENSSLAYDVLIRPELRSDYAQNKDNWTTQHHDVYVKLSASTTQEQVEKQLVQLVERHQPADTSFMKGRGYMKDENGHYQSLRLLPVTDLHFNREVGAFVGAVSKSYIYTLLLISLFILAIACFNFINLNIARAFTRTREVGVRKCLGAGRAQVFGQMWGESLLVSLAGLAIGVVAAIVLVPYFNQLFRAGLRLSFFYQPSTIVMLVISLLLVSLIAGGYPAMVLSRFPISGVLRGTASLRKPGLLRNSLIVLQFTAACTLMACTLIAYRQFEYIRHQPLGYEKDELISIPVEGMDARLLAQRFRERLGSQSAIAGISASNVNLGLGRDGGTSRSSSGFGYKDKNILTNWMCVDRDFLKTLTLPLLKGRDPAPSESDSSSHYVLVSESMAKQFGVDDVVGLPFTPDSTQGGYVIAGVVPDFHLYSLHEKVQALTLDLSTDVPLRYLLVKASRGQALNAMRLVESTYKDLVPGAEFIGSFLDENTDRWYQKEKRLSTLLGISAAAAVLLSCLGLFAMAVLMIRQRVKEIGVRKVLGASVMSINNLLARDFIRLVLVALLISIPLSWWAMNSWLQEFPYRIDIGFGLFALVGLIIVVVALGTISFHTIRAALGNPVNSLRSE